MNDNKDIEDMKNGITELEIMLKCSETENAKLKEQGNNRRNNHIFEFNGETHTVSEWSYITGINVATLYGKISRGWCDEDVIKRPVQKHRKS